MKKIVLLAIVVSGTVFGDGNINPKEKSVTSLAIRLGKKIQKMQCPENKALVLTLIYRTKNGSLVLGPGESRYYCF